jgi:hypothetical protein
MPATLVFTGNDYHKLFDLLIEAASVDWSERPSITIDGKRQDLHKAVAIISKNLGRKQDLLPHHQEKIDAKFSKRQHGYGRTARNLAHRAHAIASANRARGT